jgi:hypothetical protein
MTKLRVLLGRLEKQRAEEAMRAVQAREADIEAKIGSAAARAEAAEEMMERLRWARPSSVQHCL